MSCGFNTYRHQPLVLLSAAVISSLAACSGDGSGFRTKEYRNSTGLDQIKAADGYELVTGPQGGEGVTIAILDDGIDEDHPDLAPNLISSLLFGGATDIDSSHGTAVAGIAAGAADNGGIQGVAFNAGILAFQVGDVDPDDPDATLLDSDVIASAIEEATVRDADIINMSLGFSFSGPLLLSDGTLVAPVATVGSQTIEDSMRVAANAGKLMVVSAGNDFNDIPLIEELLDLEPGTIVDIGANFPAQSAADPELANAVIAAVAVNEDNELAFFSNSCRGVEERCMAAPGVDFQGALPGGGVGSIGSGTSYSAPLISGAAAVVQAAFPGTTPQEAGNRLLSTATDLGTPGTDVLYGRGLLNLENALTPQGDLQIATSSSLDGSMAALTSSKLALGSAFALGGHGANLLSKAIALDADNFPFGIDLRGSADIRSRSTGLASFIAGSDRRTAKVSAAGLEATLSLAEDPWRDDPYRASFAPSDTALQQEDASPRFAMRSELVDGVDLFFGLNGSSVTEASVTNRITAGSGLFQPTAFFAPYDQLAGEQTGGGAAIALGENTDLHLSTFTSADKDLGREASMQKIELTHRTFGDVELRIGYGFVTEEGGYLGGETSGAFGGDSSGRSHYVDLSFLAPLSDRLALFGGYSYGVTNASGGSGLVSDLSSLQSSAFGTGFSLVDLVSEGDGFSFMVGQPLRVSEGSAEVTVPVGRTETGEVLQESGKLDLSPSGREIAFEATYEFALESESHGLATGAFIRLNPDHDPDAKPDMGIGLKYTLNF